MEEKKSKLTSSKLNGSELTLNKKANFRCFTTELQTGVEACYFGLKPTLKGNKKKYIEIAGVRNNGYDSTLLTLRANSREMFLNSK